MVAVDSLTCNVLLLLLLMCSVPTEVDAQAMSLSNDEVEALREIAVQLGKKDWNFSLDPCSNEGSWQPVKLQSYNNTIVCNCTYLSGVCHVAKITLKGQDLDGMLPPSIVKLPYLKAFIVTRNYLSGSIPPEWASTKLEFLSLSVNRLTGKIPSYLGQMTSLTYLSLENNLFFGVVPPELGNLVNMATFILNANNFTGELPFALTNMTKLIELRISSNNFSGKVPSFIQNWEHLQILEIEGSGFQGPIPPSISTLKNLIELRIMDLHGKGSTFPQLENMTNMQYLRLSSCNISGPMPGYITKMSNIKVLDLSFNRLSGFFPTNLEGLTHLEYMYLTGNLLTGPIPNWIMQQNSRTTIDLSYNNLTRSSLPTTCRETLNLFRSSSIGSNKVADECLNNFPCSKVRYSVHINCGGGETTIGSTIYEGDEVAGGAAKYVPTQEGWEVSTTGHFWDTETLANGYISKNVSLLRMNNLELYTTARLSPLSFTYYVRCLANGSYIVKLHFAEIVIRDNRSFHSLGRRVFDVYIQDKVVLKDFDIRKEAQGVDKVLIKEFKAIVEVGTVEILFRWTGKGTTIAPKRPTYGPLISVIDVEADFKPPSNRSKRKKLIALGVGVLAVLFIFIIIGILWWKGYLGGRKLRNSELIGLNLQTGIFTFRQIKAATNDFDPTSKIGEGGFGPVYKGVLSNGTVVAVKQLSSKSKQGNREFVNEIGMISALQHPNLVRLFGCCVEGRQLFLVYEYMENNSVAHVLFGKKEDQLNLDWPTRHRICVGIAKGLAFLHEESAIKIVHRDIKATNVLLDKELNPKISDFGLAKLDDEENTHISTRIAGTIGYMAPEYALWGRLTYKADVYSFGVVALEIVAGENNTKCRPNDDFLCLVDWALVLQQEGNLMELVDPRLEFKSKFEKEVLKVIQVALLCTNPSPALRPTMSTAVSMLEGTTEVHKLTVDSNLYGNGFSFNATRKQYDQVLVGNSSDVASSSNTI